MKKPTYSQLMAQEVTDQDVTEYVEWLYEKKVAELAKTEDSYVFEFEDGTDTKIPFSQFK